ncbi:hypothetical protein DT019_08525 [Streptomyces sp. SDr-06]|nr:hypothetical protein DT019_08525 [Streptomyces sp. SDr-06]
MGGRLISLGQRLIGCPSRFSHAFLVLDNGQIIQGEPGGAKIYSESDWPGAVYSKLPLTDSQRAAIVAAGRALVGTPYSWLDYVAIGAQRLGLPFKGLRRYVSDSGHMICSQLVADAYASAGVELFPDRAPGNVTPGDLARLINAR